METCNCNYIKRKINIFASTSLHFSKKPPKHSSLKYIYTYTKEHLYWRNRHMHIVLMQDMLCITFKKENI